MAKLGIFARPKMSLKTMNLLKGRFFNYKVKSGVVVDEAGFGRVVTIGIGSGAQKIRPNQAGDFLPGRISGRG